MKKLTILFGLISIMNLANAQVGNIVFMKYNGQQVTSKDSADFIRIIQKSDSVPTHFKLTEYYKNGKIKTEGPVLKSEGSPIYEGQVVSYDDKGTRRLEFTYEKGKKIDKGYYYYGNGKLNKIEGYDRISTASTSQNLIQNLPRTRVEYFADSSGNIIVKDGNGHFKQTIWEGKKNIVQEGDYVNGLKDGLWTGNDASGNYWYKEKFMKGKFLSGESAKDGQTYYYALEGELPTFVGGITEFYTYLKRNVRYPSAATEGRIMGKVYLSFVIQNDGTVTDVKVIRGVSPSLDLEAIRVLKNSPKWTPGKQHGIPVKTLYSIPISFSLTSSQRIIWRN